MSCQKQATPEAKIQSPALMAVLNRLAVGADVSELVSIVCQVRVLGVLQRGDCEFGCVTCWSPFVK